MLNENSRRFIEFVAMAIGMFCFGKMFGNSIHVAITFPIAVVGVILSLVVLLDKVSKI